jgi:hypothetical protein
VAGQVDDLGQFCGGNGVLVGESPLASNPPSDPHPFFGAPGFTVL